MSRDPHDDLPGPPFEASADVVAVAITLLRELVIAQRNTAAAADRIFEELWKQNHT